MKEQLYLKYKEIIVTKRDDMLIVMILHDLYESSQLLSGAQSLYIAMITDLERGFFMCNLGKEA